MLNNLEKNSKEGIIKFFRQPVGLHKPTAQERSRVTVMSGIYAWYSDLTLAKQSDPVVPINGLWRIDDFLLLYIGIVTGRPIKKRLYYASGGGRADQHQVQMGLGCLLAKTLDIELRRGKQPGFLRFIPRELLRIWIGTHVYFKWMETNEAEKLESILIAELHPLLNKAHNEKHPFCSTLKSTIDLHKRRADKLPIID